jgi:hypothetical protein
MMQMRVQMVRTSRRAVLIGRVVGVSAFCRDAGRYKYRSAGAGACQRMLFSILFVFTSV